ARCSRRSKRARKAAKRCQDPDDVGSLPFLSLNRRVKHLFMEGRAVPTLLLWVPFFTIFMVLVTVTFWTPAVLNSAGFSLSAAALIIGFNNLGSVIASATSGWAVHRGGAFRVLIPCAMLGGLSLAWFGQATSSIALLCIASFLAGFFVGGTGTG